MLPPLSRSWFKGTLQKPIGPAGHGYRRVQAALGRQKVFISEKVVRRLMKQEHNEAASMPEK